MENAIQYPVSSSIRVDHGTQPKTFDRDGDRDFSRRSKKILGTLVYGNNAQIPSWTSFKIVHHVKSVKNYDTHAGQGIFFST